MFKTGGLVAAAAATGAGVVQVDKGIACGPGMGTLSTTDVRNITGQAYNVDGGLVPS